MPKRRKPPKIWPKINLSNISRKPIFGVVPPGRSQRISVDPPVDPHERPLILGQVGAFKVETVEDSTAIVLTNLTDVWVSFVLFIVPSFIAGAAVFPWRQFLERIKAPDGLAKAGMAIWYRLQQQLLDPKGDT